MDTTMQRQRPGSRRQFKREMSNRIAVRWEEVWKLLPEAMKGNDPEAVHAARVASRRLRAAMDGAAGVFPGPWYRSLHKSAKMITRTLGDVRDRDVLLEKLAIDRERADPDELPGIDYLVEQIAADRNVARSAMKDALGKSRLRRVRKQSRARFPAPGKRARRKGSSSHVSSLPKGSRKHIDKQATDLFSYGPIIPDGNAVEELHDAAQLIEDTKGLQEVLGELHDLDVHIELVGGELDGQRGTVAAADPHLVESLEAIVERDRRNREDIHHVVIARWQGLMEDGFRERLDRVSAKR